MPRLNNVDREPRDDVHDSALDMHALDCTFARNTCHPKSAQFAYKHRYHVVNDIGR